MAHLALSIKTALTRIGAITAGAAGALAVMNWLASPRRHPRTHPAAVEPATASIGAGPAAKAKAPPPAHPHAPDRSSSRRRDEAPPPAHPRARDLAPGWSRVEHIGLPQPTYWPAVLALAITFLAWGLVTSWLISVVGLALFVVALAGWIRDLRHGH